MDAGQLELKTVLISHHSYQTLINALLFTLYFIKLKIDFDSMKPQNGTTTATTTKSTK